jgi:hypothetical protein
MFIVMNERLRTFWISDSYIVNDILHHVYYPNLYLVCDSNLSNSLEQGSER